MPFLIFCLGRGLENFSMRLVDKLQQTCQFYQVVTSLRITSFDNQLATSLWTTYNRPIVDKLSESHAKRILISACCNKLLQDAYVNKLVAACAVRL